MTSVWVRGLFATGRSVDVTKIVQKTLPDGNIGIYDVDTNELLDIRAEPYAEVASEVFDPMVDDDKVVELAPIHPLSVFDPELGVHREAFGSQSGGILTNNRMPSKAVGNTKVHYSEFLGNPSASGTLFSPGSNGWVVGEALHLAELAISGFNSATSAAQFTHYRLRDGGAAGTIKWEHVGSRAQGSLGSVPRDFEGGYHFEEHPVFLSDVYLEIVTGTLTMAVNLFGYSVAP